MNKKILSIIVMLALAISVVIGTVVVANANADVDGLALTLEDNITAHIQITECDGASYANVTFENADTGDQKTVENVSFTSQNGSTVVVSVELAVKDLDNWIYVDVMDENGEVIKTYDCSAYEYILDIADNGTVAEGKTLANNLLNYAEAAKFYFTNEEVEAPDAVDFNAPAKVANGSVAGVKLYGSSLVLESETTISHYFKVDGDIANYTFYVDYDMDGGYDEVCEYGYHETEKVTAVPYGSYYVVDIKGIAPNDLDRSYTLGVTDGTDTYTYTYSALNYAEDAWSSASPALQSLLVNFKGYLDGAETLKGTINYKNGDTLLKSADYYYGVDNYLDFAPEMTGYVFEGWYTDAACTVKADGVIPAGTTGDIDVYAKMTLVDFLSVDGLTFQNAMDQTTHTDRTVNADGTVTYTGVSGDRINFGSTFKTIENNTFPTFGGTQVTTYKFTLQLARKANTPVADFKILTNTGAACIKVEAAAADADALVKFGMDVKQFGGGYVYGENQVITTLPADGSLVNVEFYVSFENFDFDLNTNQMAYIYAYNQKGTFCELYPGGTRGSAFHDNEYYTFRLIPGTVNSAATLTVGSFHAVPVNADFTEINANAIVDGDGNLVSHYNAFEALRLPEQYGDGSLEFAGWYADAEHTKKINSIPAGLAGTVTVYPKFISSNNLVYMANGEIVNQVPCSSDAATPIDYIPTAAPGYLFEGWYTDAALTTKAGDSVPAGSEGNTIVYAKFGNYDLFCGSKSDYFQIGVGKTTSNTTKNSDGTVTYTGVSGAKQILGPDWRPMTNESLLTINGTKITTYKFSLEIARVANTPVAGFTLNGVYAGTYFEVTTADADQTAYVKMAGGTSGSTNVTVAELPADGSVVTIDFYLSFDGFDFDGANQRVHGYAYNTDGELVEGGTWGATLHAGEYYMFLVTPNAANTSDSAITIGEFRSTPVNADFTDIAQVIS